MRHIRPSGADAIIAQSMADILSHHVTLSVERRCDRSKSALFWAANIRGVRQKGDCGRDLLVVAAIVELNSMDVGYAVSGDAEAQSS